MGGDDYVIDEKRGKAWGRSGEALAWYQAELDRVEAERDRLRDLAGCAYQAMGVHDAPVPWLDALYAASAGEPFTTADLLPYRPT